MIIIVNYSQSSSKQELQAIPCRNQPPMSLRHISEFFQDPLTCLPSAKPCGHRRTKIIVHFLCNCFKNIIIFLFLFNAYTVLCTYDGQQWLQVVVFWDVCLEWRSLWNPIIVECLSLSHWPSAWSQTVLMSLPVASPSSGELDCILDRNVDVRDIKCIRLAAPPAFIQTFHHCWTYCLSVLQGTGWMDSCMFFLLIFYLLHTFFSSYCSLLLWMSVITPTCWPDCIYHLNYSNCGFC